jgi:hypothetical protein
MQRDRGLRQKCGTPDGCGLGSDGKSQQDQHLIWLFTGQLINVRTGELVLDDSTELKGDPEPMVRAGTRIFAERVARAVKQEVASTR